MGERVVNLDKYDKAIEYLMGCNGNYRREVNSAWNAPWGEPAGCLFKMVRSDDALPGTYGCLTMIKRGSYEARTKELTNAIRADTRIPSDPTLITKDSLPVLAEWQRRIDKELQRV